MTAASGAPAAPGEVLIAGGGTAGHLVPGLAIAEALVARGRPSSSIHFVGSDRGVEARMVPAAGFTLDQLPGRGIPRRPGLAQLKAIVGLVRGTWRGIALVRRRRPAVVVSLGGHAAFAGAFGAVLTRTPLLLVEQNVRAGAVNRRLGRFSRGAAVSFPDTDLPRGRLTGNPLRRPLVDAAVARRGNGGARVRDEARRELGLPTDRTVLLVTTGSLGAQKVNRAVVELIDRWRDRSDLAIRLVTGRRDHPEIATRLAERPVGALHVDLVAYEDAMPVALAAADVAVTRGGAGTCAELAAFGVPAVMVPLPIATRDHQRANVETLVRAGAATMVLDAELDADRLERELAPLLGDPAVRAAQAKAMAGEARLDAADQAAALVEEVIGG